jgi:hypothetical protein
MRRSLVFLILVLAACGGTLYPITNGTYTSLPPQGTAVAVWGVNEDAVSAAEDWLERRGLVIVPRKKLRASLPSDEQHVAQVAMKQVVAAAAAAGATEVVLVETAALPAFPASVIVHGLDAATGNEVWQASAWFAVAEVGHRDLKMDTLTCQALATLWGFRPAGYHEIPSATMCEVGKTGPHGHPVGPYKKLG